VLFEVSLHKSDWIQAGHQAGFVAGAGTSAGFRLSVEDLGGDKAGSIFCQSLRTHKFLVLPLSTPLSYSHKANKSDDAIFLFHTSCCGEFSNLSTKFPSPHRLIIDLSWAMQCICKQTDAGEFQSKESYKNKQA
jgi:hypothetical protein